MLWILMRQERRQTEIGKRKLKLQKSLVKGYTFRNRIMRDFRRST